jgi:peptidoglycan/xylan/chitin deacetylase (PgdA/CDA1 family)
MSQLELGLPLTQKYAFPGTLYVSTKLVGRSEFYMDWNGVREFHERGWEIGAHGHTHSDLTKVSETELEGELVLPIEIISREVGVVPTSFASPFGSFDDIVLGRVRRYYQSHVQAWGEEMGQFNTEINPHTLIRFNVQHTDTAETICRAIERATDERRWIVLAFHKFVKGDTLPEEYSVSAITYDETLSCVARLRDEGVVQVVTVREALGMVLGVGGARPQNEGKVQ